MVISLTRRLMPRVAQALTSRCTRDARRWFAERRRLLRGEPHRVLYFHQVDDPYSHLAAQVLRTFVDRYDVLLEPILAGPPTDEAAPERARLEALSRKDAADVAGAYGLAFPPREAAPESDLVDLASRILAGAIASGLFVDGASRVGRALWEGDRRALGDLAREMPPADPGATRAAIASGSERRHRMGHYLGAMFHYGGEWFWGVDRLHHLERRLRSLGALRRAGEVAPIVPRPDFRGEPVPRGDGRLTLEFYASLRSPYSYISMERVFALPLRYPVDLVLRPVLPMVMRGLPVPRAKRMYIVLDTKREAEDAGVPFGRICDPLGRPIERALSLFAWARDRGRAPELLLSFARGAFAEGIDAGEDAGLGQVVCRAGLSWEEAKDRLEAEGWREEIEANRRALLSFGLWGVPSFRLLGPDGEPGFCAWGQDRIWLVEEQIRRRLGARRSLQGREPT